jgi:hypothetical protein
VVKISFSIMSVTMSNLPRDFVIIVSGLPRSGTSLMMQMLRAGGLPVLTDNLRTADDDNPYGYLEFERVKQIKRDKAWLDEAHGKAVKIIHLLLMELPSDHKYRVIFMRRDLNEVVQSQAKMLERSGRHGAKLPREKLMEAFQNQLNQVMAWLGTQPNVQTLELDYSVVVSDASTAACRVNVFLGGGLDETEMTRSVDPALYRNRG